MNSVAGPFKCVEKPAVIPVYRLGTQFRQYGEYRIVADNNRPLRGSLDLVSYTWIRKVGGTSEITQLWAQFHATEKGIQYIYAE